MTNETIINFKDVSLNLGNKTILDNISFIIKKGTVTTLIGRNGAGKSSIAKLIVGLIKPSKGEIILQKKLKIGYAPQQIATCQNLPMNSSAILNVLAPNYNVSLLEEIKEFINIQSILKKNITELSGGQLQKLMLIGNILSKPDLLLLDEPTQYLDVTTQQQFYKLLTHIKEKYRQSVFMISHDLFTVMKNSDQIICLDKHICCSGRPEKVFTELKDANAISEIGLYIHKHDHSHD